MALKDVPCDWKLSMQVLCKELSAFAFHEHRITNFEMETSAMYGLGQLLGHECVSISVILAR
jgi:uridine phosphorylase